MSLQEWLLPGAVGGDVLIERPWERVRDPVPLPIPMTSVELRGLKDAEFARVLRDHLLPRAQSGPAYEAWRQLWRILAAPGPVGNRAEEILETLRAATVHALAADVLDAAARRRATKFVEQCDGAIDRLASHLTWAAPGLRQQLGPTGRRIVHDLAMSIVEHRQARHGQPRALADERLWNTLRKLDLEPPEIDIDA